jgi:hypothetical protein
LSASLGYVASATMGGLDLLRQQFTIGSGATTPIEVTMRDDFAELEGTVDGLGIATASPGTSYSGLGNAAQQTKAGGSAVVYLVPLADSAGEFEQLGTDENGKFDSPSVPPGTYRVMAFKKNQGDLPYGEPEGMKAYESKGQVVHLSGGQKTTVELQLISDSQ